VLFLLILVVVLVVVVLFFLAFLLNAFVVLFLLILVVVLVVVVLFVVVFELDAGEGRHADTRWPTLASLGEHLYCDLVPLQPELVEGVLDRLVGGPAGRLNAFHHASLSSCGSRRAACLAVD